MKKATKAVLCLILIGITLFSHSISYAKNLIQKPDICNCVELTKKNKYVPNQTKIDEVTHYEQLSDEFSDYKRVGSPQNIQRGGTMIIASGTKKTVKYSISAGIPVKIISAALGVDISNETFDLSGQTSPPAKQEFEYIAPYFRSAWHRYKCTVTTSYYCQHGQFLKQTSKDTIVKIPFNDSKRVRFGHSEKKKDLKTRIAKPDDELFK